MLSMIIAAALAAGLPGSQAQAQAVPPATTATPTVPAVPHGRMQRDLTREQARQEADSLFQHDDANHDGIVTREEAEAAISQALSARGGDADETGARVERMLDRMFGGAPSVTLEQFEAQALARFDRQDLNHDGVVTAAERKQGWASRAQ